MSTPQIWFPHPVVCLGPAPLLTSAILVSKSIDPDMAECLTPRVQTLSFTANAGTGTHLLTCIFTFSLPKG